jgi:hypothetical protein
MKIFLICLVAGCLFMSCNGDKDEISLCVQDSLSLSFESSFLLSQEVIPIPANATRIIKSDEEFTELFREENKYIDFSTHDLLVYSKYITEFILQSKEVIYHCDSETILLQLTGSEFSNPDIRGDLFWVHAIVEKTTATTLEVEINLADECGEEKPVSFQEFEFGYLNGDSSSHFLYSNFVVSYTDCSWEDFRNGAFIANNQEELEYFQAVYNDELCLNLDFTDLASFENGSLVVVNATPMITTFDNDLYFDCNTNSLTINSTSISTIFPDNVSLAFVFPLDTHLNNNTRINHIIRY